MTTDMLSPLELACMLYKLTFPERDLLREPESVQQSYRNDAIRLQAMMTEAENAIDQR